MRARYCRYGELGERTGAIGDGVDTLGDAILKSMDTVLHRLRPVRPRPVSQLSEETDQRGIIEPLTDRLHLGRAHATSVRPGYALPSDCESAQRGRDSWVRTSRSGLE